MYVRIKWWNTVCWAPTVVPHRQHKVAALRLWFSMAHLKIEMLLRVISVFGHAEDHGLQSVGGHPWRGPGWTGRDGCGGRGRGGRLREWRDGRRGVDRFLRHTSRQPWKPPELRRILRTRGVRPFRGCLRNQKPWRWGNFDLRRSQTRAFVGPHSRKRWTVLSLLQVLWRKRFTSWPSLTSSRTMMLRKKLHTLPKLWNMG